MGVKLTSALARGVLGVLIDAEEPLAASTVTDKHPGTDNIASVSRILRGLVDAGAATEHADAPQPNRRPLIRYQLTVAGRLVAADVLTASTQALLERLHILELAITDQDSATGRRMIDLIAATDPAVLKAMFTTFVVAVPDRAHHVIHHRVGAERRFLERLERISKQGAPR